MKLKIEYIPIDKIKPYEKNAKKHDKKSVAVIKNSIAEFGMCDPIGVWGNNNIIVEGHGRLMALKKLGYTEAPIIRLDHLTNEQRRAYTLAHNKTNEFSEWDFDFLNAELDDICDIDISDFGFDAYDKSSQGDIENEEYKENERTRTLEAYNLNYYDNGRTAGKYQMPTLTAVDYIPSKMIGFNKMMTSTEYDSTIHFFIDDYQFERIWNNPQLYFDKTAQFAAVLTPDFSLYMDMPYAMKIWNVYRSRLIGQMCQDYGIRVIPTLSWAEEETFEFCFDGLPQNSTVAISTVGVMRSKEAKEIFYKGCNEFMRRLKPKNIINYGKDSGYDFENANVVYYKTGIEERISGR